MGRIVVEVMPKPEILDPQGKAVAAGLPRLSEDWDWWRRAQICELSV